MENYERRNSKHISWMKGASPIQIVKDSETFFPIVTKYFQEKGVINHLQAKFLVDVSREVQQSKKHQLSPMKSKLIKKGVSSEFAMQFVLQYLLKKNLTYTFKCGEIELPNAFIVYQTTTTISSKLKLRKPPTEWLSEILMDYKEGKNQINSDTQKNEQVLSTKTQENSFDIDFDSDETKDTNSLSKDENGNLKNDDKNDIIEEEEYSNSYDNLTPLKQPQLIPKSNAKVLNKFKPVVNRNNIDFDSDSS